MTDHGESRQGTPEGPQRFERELMEADLLFAREVAGAAAEDRGRVWSSWFTADGRQILPGQVVQGTGSIADLMGPVFSSAGYSLSWAPDIASASAAGDMGWTSGRYVSRRQGPAETVEQGGRYLTIWRRQEDGRWRAVLDTGVPDPTP